MLLRRLLRRCLVRVSVRTRVLRRVEERLPMLNRHKIHVRIDNALPADPSMKGVKVHLID